MLCNIFFVYLENFQWKRTNSQTQSKIIASRLRYWTILSSNFQSMGIPILFFLWPIEMNFKWKYTERSRAEARKGENDVKVAQKKAWSVVFVIRFTQLSFSLFLLLHLIDRQRWQLCCACFPFTTFASLFVDCAMVDTIFRCMMMWCLFLFISF